MRCQFAEKWFEYEGTYGMTRIARARQSLSKAVSFTAEKLHLTSHHKHEKKAKGGGKKGAKVGV